MNFNLTLPDLDNISDSSSLQQIKGYLSLLNEQLRYMMLNIDSDNLSTTLSDTINGASTTAEFAKESIISLGESISSVSQTADKISWIIADGGEKSNFSLTSYAADLISESINIQGYVKFTDIESQGSTVIDGANIKTGSLSADKLDVDDLSAVSASIGGWSLSSSSISSSSNNGCSLILSSANDLGDYWMRASDADGSDTFYIKKDGSCYIKGSFISDGSITADKLLADDDYRLDLSTLEGGVKLFNQLIFTNNSVNRNLHLNNEGTLVFSTGAGNTSFTFGLFNNYGVYTLSLYDGAGNFVGNIPFSS